MTADSLEESLGPLRTTEEVAAYLGKSERTVRRLFHKGLLVGVHVGQSIRYRDSAVEDYLRGQSETRPKTHSTPAQTKPKRHPRYS